MCIQFFPFCIPWIGCVGSRWKAFLTVISAPVAVVVVLYMKLNSSRECLEFLREAAVEEAEHGIPYLKKTATDRDPEIDHDSEWASAYSVAIDRHIVSACFALDALDRNHWPWETTEVRKALARVDKCSGVMLHHSSAAARRFLDTTGDPKQIAEKD